MIPDWEIWAIALKLMKDHGDIAAEEEAFNRGKALQTAGDSAGYELWQRVQRRIIELKLTARTATRQ